MSSDQVRETFLSFFQERGHKRIGGSSLIPDNDPTLLFVNSGMAPLKAYFTGQQKPPQPELCNVQPCLRTVDIDDVGDRHHLTLFEMLGSWSIGGYFKERAIEFAYELLTDGFGLDPDRLWASVFDGDEALGLPPDEESAAIWEKTGLPRSRVVPHGLADNFWGPAGDTGPCGPCTEVFYDFGEAYGPAYDPAKGDFASSSRYIEIWNAGVFMQLNKTRDGRFEPLPFRSVDTGAGLERLTMALNEVGTVYETDLFVPLIARCKELLGDSGETTARHRLLADHIRSATFLLAEGIAPSNEGRGYVPRRLIRRCVSVARQSGVEHLDMGEVAAEVIRLMGPSYPMLEARRDEIMRLLSAEEQEFSLTLQRGLGQLDEMCKSGGPISGVDAFRLFSTHGLPFELTRELAAERGTSVDEAGFREQYRLHQEVSRGQSDRQRRLSHTDPLADLPMPGQGHFTGYETTESKASVVALFVEGQPVDRAGPGEEVEVLLDVTPFYAEAGGQVGDAGVLAGVDGAMVEILDTTRHPSGYHVHLGRVQAQELRVDQEVLARVDEPRRRKIESNHSATHLLNAALRSVLGPHVRQAGSLVAPDRLRFDFTHPSRVTPAELARIERIVNDEVFRHHATTTKVLPIDEAKGEGAIFLEGEDYRSPVRVVALGAVSKEFCGGTHVTNTGEISLFKIMTEQSVSAGVRRITAVTKNVALDTMLDRDQLLVEAARRAKCTPSELPDRIEQLRARHQPDKSRASVEGEVEVQVTQAAGFPLGTAVVGEAVDLRSVAAERAQALGAVVAVGSVATGKSRVVVAVPDGLRDTVDARKVLAAILTAGGGRGGGTARLAEGGGGQASELPASLARLPDVLGNGTAQAD